MRRGEVWTAAGGKDYAGKPRPVVILQGDQFDATGSITICAFTTDPTEAPLFRVPIEPNEKNGLRAPCRLMVDKITTIPKTKIRTRLGRLDDEGEPVAVRHRQVRRHLAARGAPRQRRSDRHDLGGDLLKERSALLEGALAVTVEGGFGQLSDTLGIGTFAGDGGGQLGDASRGRRGNGASHRSDPTLRKERGRVGHPRLDGTLP